MSFWVTSWLLSGPQDEETLKLSAIMTSSELRDLEKTTAIMNEIGHLVCGNSVLPFCLDDLILLFLNLSSMEPAGESSRDPLDVSTQEAQPSSVATPVDGVSNSGGGSSSSYESRDNYPFRIMYRDHSSDNLAEGPYSWVDPEVLRVSSLLTRLGSLLGMTSAICQPRTWSVSVSACQPGESVCMSSVEGPEPFFYLHDTLHSKLGIKLPFTHFEWAVLQALNVAPMQLHPNSWAFIRAFELLCEDLGKAPILGVFFWFFTPRKTDQVRWTSLSNRAKCKLLRPFLESYKTFKDRFFRVVPSDPNSRLLIDRSGRSYFPL
ncbi:hypothetical protein CR513_27078, partial [Mucuna pruriens]